MEKKNSLSHKLVGIVPLITLIFITAIAGLVFRDKYFFSIANIGNVFLKAAKNGGLLALGMTVVIICGEIDLSVGAVFALSGVVMGIVAQLNPWLGLLAGIFVGLVSGLLSGWLVAKLKISSWIVSLAMLFAWRGVCMIIAKRSVRISSSLRFSSYNFRCNLPGLQIKIPLFIIIFLVLTIVFSFLMHSTRYGLQLYAVGGNKEAARMMGLNVDKIKFLAFLISGIIAALAGILLASSSGSASLSAGNMYETYAIAMCAIGGVKLSGGYGSVLGTFSGVLIYFVINTIFTYLPSSISVHWQSVLMGVLVLISVASQSEVLNKWHINIKVGKRN